MLPVLFELGPIKVYSFGLMLGLAFIVANYLFAREIRRRGMPEQVAGTITLIALVAGIAGSKLFSLIENWDRFLADPVGETFSAAGLTFYGGLILATLLIGLYVRMKKLRFLPITDAVAPSLILAYGIGRIGCQLAGDGDYGIPSKLPWAMSYPDGTVPTNGFVNSGQDLTELGRLYQSMFGDPVPAQIPVHPTPVYETLAAIAIFAFLWSIRKRPMAAGMLFAIYLILAGVERFLVEFIRLNDRYLLDLSMSQWISIGMILLGSGMIYKLRSQPPEPISQNKKSRKPVTQTGRKTEAAR
jgi:phosphatidylglycerol:prolipoprotein diacylglycerol transferase